MTPLKYGRLMNTLCSSNYTVRMFEFDLLHFLALSNGSVKIGSSVATREKEDQVMSFHLDIVLVELNGHIIHAQYGNLISHA